MKAFLFSAGIAFFLMAFVADKNSPIDASLITGRWQLTERLRDGVDEKPEIEFSEVFYTFRAGDSVIVESIWRVSGDTLTSRGTYRVNASRNKLTTRFGGRSNTITIHELSSTTLVLTAEYKPQTKGVSWSRKRKMPKVKCEDRYTKVQ